VPSPEAARVRLEAGAFDLDDYLAEVEHRLIETAQSVSVGNLSHAAKLLNVNRTTLYSKIERLQGRRG
jgi:DNA-binding NtrC family response regulator